MRTTVTLDKDVERLLKERMHRSRRGFKETLNATLRAAPTARPDAVRTRPFIVKARVLGLRAGIDPAGFNKLADELEAEAFLVKRRDRLVLELPARPAPRREGAADRERLVLCADQRRERPLGALPDG